MTPLLILLALLHQEAASPRPQDPKAAIASRPGFGDLMVGPTRVVLEGARRSEELTLVNVGPRTATYRISFVQMKMEEDGSIRELAEKEPGGRYADELIRYSPRQVTLEPNVAQTVRLQLRKPENLAAGEYRSHLVFRYVPEAEAVESLDKPPEGGITVQFIPLYGVAVPVIVRHGQTQAQASLSEAHYLPSPQPTIEGRLLRTGTQSIYGQIRVIYHPSGSILSQTVGSMKGLAVYDGLAHRKFSIPLQVPGKSPLSPGTLRIIFSPPDSDQVLAETSLEIR